MNSHPAANIAMVVLLVFALAGRANCQAGPLLPGSGAQGRVYDVTVAGVWNGNVRATPDNSSDDDTAAIQATINYAAASVNSRGAVVFLPAGTYDVQGTLTVSGHNVALVGSGAGTTIKRKGPPSGALPLLVVQPSPTLGMFISNVSVRHMQLVEHDWGGTNWVTKPAAYIGLKLVGTSTSIVEDVSVAGFGTGLQLVRGNHLLMCRDFLATGCAYGLRVTDEENGLTGLHAPETWEWQTECNFDHCVFTGVPAGAPYSGQMTCGIQLHGGVVGDQTFTNCRALHCNYGVAMVRVNRPELSSYYTRSIIFDSLACDWCGASSILAQGFSDVKVVNSFIGVKGMYLEACDNWSIGNCELHGRLDISLAGQDAIILGERDASRSFLPLQSCSHIRVTGNGFQNWGRAIASAGARYSSISGNTFKNVNSGVLIHAANYDAVYNTVTGNAFEGSVGQKSIEELNVAPTATGLPNYNYFYANTYGGGMAAPTKVGANSVIL